MIYKNDLIETSRSHLGLGVDIGRAALQPVYIPIEKLSETNLCDWVASARLVIAFSTTRACCCGTAQRPTAT